jgi:hypothetical protein
MKKGEEYLLERQYATDEVMSRLMMIIAEALPHTHQTISNLHNEWVRIVNEITAEYTEVVDGPENEQKDT